MEDRYITVHETSSSGGPTLREGEVLVVDTRPQSGPPVILARSTGQAGRALVEILNAKEDRANG